MITEELTNTEIERATIGTLMWTNENFADITDGLLADAFTDASCRCMYKTIRQMYKNHCDYHDPLLVYNECSKYDASITYDVVHDIWGNVEPLELRQYVTTLIELQQRRTMQHTFALAATQLNDRTIKTEDVIEQTLQMVTTANQSATADAVTMYNCITDLYQRINKNLANTKPNGITTGFVRLDERGGLHPTDLVIIGAESSQGKTALACTIAMNAAIYGTKTMYYSMEMDTTQLTARIVSRFADISSSNLLYTPINVTKVDNGLNQAICDAAKNVLFDARSINNIDSIIGSIRTNVARHGIQLVIVDYLQIIGLNTDRKNTEQATADAARKLKNIAKELGICVILLSQLNRDNYNGTHEPSANRLRASGQINEAADLTLLVYRPCVFNERYPHPYENVDTNGTALIKIDKDRNGSCGGVGSFIVGFNAETTYFYELDALPTAAQVSNTSTETQSYLR